MQIKTCNLLAEAAFLYWMGVKGDKYIAFVAYSCSYALWIDKLWCIYWEDPVQISLKVPPLHSSLTRLFNLLQIFLGGLCGCMFSRVHSGIRELIICFHGLPERILQERNEDSEICLSNFLALQHCTGCFCLCVHAWGRWDPNSAHGEHIGVAASSVSQQSMHP